MIGYNLIEKFIEKNFPDIEGVLLFGSYIDNQKKANDVDLLLMSNRFLYSSKELFVFEGMKFNTIKFTVSEIFSIMAKEYRQGDFYKLVFEKGIILVDKQRDLQIIRQYIINYYPEHNKDILASGLNETAFKLMEYADTLKKNLSQIEYFTITSRIIFHLIDWFLLSNGIHNVKADTKYKSTFFSKYFPVENKSLMKLVFSAQKNNQKKFLLELNSVLEKYLIKFKGSYSNDLIFDNYTHQSLILFVANLFTFADIKDIIQKIKSNERDLQFYIYQVDEDNQEKAGCYIVFDNSGGYIENKKEQWLSFFTNEFSKFQYTFPYNNIYCYPEIKFLGTENEKVVSQLLTIHTNLIMKYQMPKESFFLKFLTHYLSKVKINVDDIYNFYLVKLTAKRRSSNYFSPKIKEAENEFIEANFENEKKLLSAFKYKGNVDFNLDFKVVTDVPMSFHFQVLDRLISPLLKNDFEKLFYIHCLRKLNE